MFDIVEACKSYAKENEDMEGKAVELVLPENFNEICQYTTSLWGDGVPVTKMFERNPSVRIFACKGTKLQGVLYCGRRSGSMIFEFFLNGWWVRSYTLHEQFRLMTEIK